MSNTQLYWICQASGWFLYWLLSTFYNLVSSQQNASLQDKLEGQISIGIFVFSGLLATHIYRAYVSRNGWLKLSGAAIIKRLALSVLILPLIILIIYAPLSFLFGQWEFSFELLKPIDSLSILLGLGLISSSWIMLYFGIQYFRNYKEIEFTKLKQEALIREVTLNKLRSQLNPHFIFNSLNSIRALVNSDPDKARSAITYLANIFRKTLQMDKVSLTSFNEELQIVQDYLKLEKIRYEDRLDIELNIDPISNDFKIPPLMLQTLVENAIKHGISQLPLGGKLTLHTSLINDQLQISISNPGKYQPKSNQQGFGLSNTRERLHILYDGKASFEIKSIDDANVETQILIPKINAHD